MTRAELLLRPTLLEDLKENISTLFKPTRPIPRPSAAVYRTWKPFTTRINVLITGTVTFIAGLLLSVISLQLQQQLLGQAGLLLVGAVAPFAFALFLAYQDKYEREPRYLLPLVLAWGVAVPFLVVVQANYFGLAFYRLTGDRTTSSLLLSIVDAPVFEEVYKALGVFFLGIVFVKTRDEFNGPMDGLVWGAMAGAGFAIAENFLFLVVPSLGGTLQSRAFAGAMHVAQTAVVCRWLGVVKARYGIVRGRDFLVAVVPGILIHAFWNGSFDLLSRLIDLRLASLWFFLVLLGVLFLLWKLITEFRAIEESWGYSVGHAPVEREPPR